MFFTLRLKKLPFQPVYNQIIYIENGYNEEVNRYIQKNYDAIRSNFKKRGYEFCYLPKLAEEVLQKEVVAYNVPWAEGFKSDVTFSSDWLINYLVNPQDSNNIMPSLVFWDPYIIDDIYPRAATLFKGIALTRDSGYLESDNFSCYLSDIDYYCYENTPKFSLRIDKDSPISDKECDDEEFDSETRQKMEELKALAESLRKRGLPEYVLEQLVRGKEKLSRLYITNDFRFFLSDYDNKEVKMTPIHKALYLLYLRYPEGIMYHDMVDHKDELLAIYKEVKGGLYFEATAKESIEMLTNHNDNSIKEKVSRIKEAFTNCINERVARHYCIEGKKMEPKKIALPRDLIVWE